MGNSSPGLFMGDEGTTLTLRYLHRLCVNNCVSQKEMETMMVNRALLTKKKLSTK